MRPPRSGTVERNWCYDYDISVQRRSKVVWANRGETRTIGCPPKVRHQHDTKRRGFGTHYSALLSFEEEPSRDEHTPTFSPEVVKAHPRAPPRAESTRGRSSQEHVNDACKQLFPQNCRTIDALPPTRATLIHHACLPGWLLLLGPGLVAGTRRRLGRDEDPTSRMARLRTSEWYFRVALET